MAGVVAGLAACVAVSACSTEPATQVSATGATFTGLVETAPGVTVEAFFQYAPAGVALGGAGSRTTAKETLVNGYPENRQEHRVRRVVTGLTPATDYHYRVCGIPTGPSGRTGGAACLDEESFTTDTDPPSQDSVVLEQGSGRTFFDFTFGGFLDVRSGPDGQNPQGLYRTVLQPSGTAPLPRDFVVSCLNVVDKVAVLSGLEPTRPGDDLRSQTLLVLDNGPGEPDLIAIVRRATPGCAFPSPDEVGLTAALSSGDAIVSDGKAAASVP